MMFYCGKCHRGGLVLGEMDDSGQRRKDGTPILSWCRDCRSKYNKEWYARIRQDPDRLEKHRVANRESKARRAATPEGRAKQRAASRESARRRRADATKREETNRMARERRALLKVNDPQAYGELLARERAQRAKRRRDPAARRSDIEARRIWHALRREERGVLGSGSPRGMELPTAGGRLPVAPLVAAVDEWLDGQPDHFAESFIDPRNLSAWRTGEYATTPADVADRVLIGIDHLWWEVWKEGEPGHERAAELFTGERVAA